MFFVSLWLSNANFISCQNKDEAHNNKAKDDIGTSTGNVLLISFDAFGWEYMDLVQTPVLDTYFKKQGVYADYILNVIPAESLKQLQIIFPLPQGYIQRHME